MHGDSTSPSFVSAIPRAEAMAEKRFSLVEVVDGLEGSDFEDSEDDFDGYLDMDEDDRDVCEHEGHSSDETTENESDRESVGAYVEIGAEEGETESSETESVHSQARSQSTLNRLFVQHR